MKIRQLVACCIGIRSPVTSESHNCDEIFTVSQKLFRGHTSPGKF